MKYIIIFLAALSIGCAKENSDSVTSFADDTNTSEIAEPKDCSGPIVFGWNNLSSHFRYDIRANCTGSVKSCGTEFEWEYVENKFNMYEGIIKVVVTTNREIRNDCPSVGTTYCNYKINTHGMQIIDMDMACDGYWPATFEMISTAQ